MGEQPKIEQSTPGPPAFAERHFTPAEIGAMWQLSTDSVRSLFEKEPGVLVYEHQVSIGRKRRYRTLRIPESVAERVHRKMLLRG